MRTYRRINGIDSVLILERDRELGGILNQCIHNGFGLHTFKEELTGPEYAGRFIKQAEELNIEYKLNTMVMDISEQKIVTAMNREEGLFEIQAKAVILAMGCRERSTGRRRYYGCVFRKVPVKNRLRWKKPMKANYRKYRMTVCRIKIKA